MTSAERPLDGTERLWAAAGHVAPPFANQLVVEGPPEWLPSEDRLASAVLAVAKAWPETRWIAGPGARPRWSLGPEPAVRTVRGASAALGGSADAPWSMEPSSAPGLLAAEVLRLDGPAPALVFRVPHHLGDGRGTWLWAAAIAAAMRGEAVPPRSAAESSEGVTTRGPSRAMAPLPADAGAVKVGRGTERAGLRWVWARRTLPTPGRRILSRFVVAAAQLVPAGRARVDVSVDLRRHDPGPPTFLNRTGLLRCDVPRPFAAEALDAQDARLRRGLDAGAEWAFVAANERLPNLPISWLGALGRRAAAASLRSQRGVASATISNFGPLDLWAMRAGAGFPSTAWFVPPGAPGLPLFVTACGVPGGLEVAAAGPSALHGDDVRPILDSLCEAFVRLGAAGVD